MALKKLLAFAERIPSLMRILIRGFYIYFFVKKNKSKLVVNMIHNLYIIKKNGICLFHKKYGSLEEDPQSIAGLLTALSMFSNAVIGEEIKIIATNNFKFNSLADDKCIFVTFNDNSDRNEGIQQMLENIKDLFYQKFPQIEQQYKSGNLKCYENFGEDLGNLIKIN